MSDDIELPPLPTPCCAYQVDGAMRSIKSDYYTPMATQDYARAAILADRARGQVRAQALDRSAKDYAIEHAEYMAKAAEAFIEAVGIEGMAREGVDNDDEDADVAMESARENVSETNLGLVDAIYEFRKRRDRALKEQP